MTALSSSRIVLCRRPSAVQLVEAGTSCKAGLIKPLLPALVPLLVPSQVPPQVPHLAPVPPLSSTKSKEGSTSTTSISDAVFICQFAVTPKAPVGEFSLAPIEKKKLLWIS